jgi:hypothetical protein
VKPSAITRILDDGEFRSTYEVGGGIGGGDENYLSYRTSRETELFGADHHPVYGYMRYHGDTDGLQVQGYGSVVISLKDSVKTGATIYGGDTLNYTAGLWPSPAREVSYESVHPFWAKSLLDGGEVAIHYFEAQFHQGVTTADIAFVQFEGKAPPKSVTDRLDRLGISWSLTRGKKEATISEVREEVFK